MANIEKIRSIVEKDFVQLIKTVFGTNLGSITLYGSFVKERFNPGVSDVNVLVTLSKVDPGAVRRLGAEGRRLIKRGRITPLVLSKDEFLTSADVFPMEYLDIVQHHRVLHGDDPTNGLNIDNTNLRHEIEHQLRGSLVSLRQLAVASARKRPFRDVLLRRRLEEWYGSLSAILRGLLRLKGVIDVPSEPKALVDAVNGVLGLEGGPLLQLLECRGGDCPDIVSLMDNLLERLAELVAIVDKLEGKR